MVRLLRRGNRRAVSMVHLAVCSICVFPYNPKSDLTSCSTKFLRKSLWIIQLYKVISEHPKPKRDRSFLCITSPMAPSPGWGKPLLQGSWDSSKGLLEGPHHTCSELIHQVAPGIPTVWCRHVPDIPCPFEVGQTAHASFWHFPVDFTAWILRWAS